MNKKQRTLDKKQIIAAVRGIQIHKLEGGPSDRDKEIILERFDMSGEIKKTLREISQQHKLSQGRVRDITVRGVRKICNLYP